MLGEIGRGATGTVFRAEDRLSGEVVALKLIEPVRDTQRELYARVFFNEVRASGLLRHPNIVPVRDAGREGDRFYVVMEYVQGGQSLEPWCTTRSLLALDRVLSVGLECAEALHYAHLKSVIHRDVKPANVLLDGGGHARLTDFGIAVLGEGGLAVTSPFVAAGSPLYMAPEQLRRDEVTPRSDLFALGLVLYQLLTGRHPFAASSVDAARAGGGAPAAVVLPPGSAPGPGGRGDAPAGEGPGSPTRQRDRGGERAEHAARRRVASARRRAGGGPGRAAAPARVL
jgi:serine/threonine-protein kinase